MGFRVARIQYEPTRNNSDTTSREKPRESAPKPGTGADSTVPPRQITNTIGMKLVLIPAGEFLTGLARFGPGRRCDEKPQHPVRITRPFYLGVHEVTQGQYRAVTGAARATFEGRMTCRWRGSRWHDADRVLQQVERAGRGWTPYY